jgi:tryptophan-rich sensory protein
MNSSTPQSSWYSQLKKPPFAPPAWVFGPVWTVLYVIIIVSFGSVAVQIWKGAWPVGVATPFVLNLAANALFTTLQFKLRNNLAAFIDVLVVLVTIPWMMAVVWPLASWVAWAQVPYLLWVSFATVLQGSVTWLNR